MPKAQLYDELTTSGRRSLRNEYVKSQQEMCYYCGTSLYADPPSKISSRPVNWKLFPPNFLRFPIHLQHNHNSGFTEGAVHAYCNAVMWQYEGR